MLFVICHPCISVSETIFAQSVSIARFGGILCFIESRSCKVFIVKYLINLRGGFRFSWCFALLWRGSLRAPAIPKAVPAGALYSWQVQPCRIGLRERGQRKKHSGPPGLGVRPAFSPRKTSLATETPTRELLRELFERSSVRRSVKSSGEKSLRYLEAAGRHRLSLFRDTTIGTWNVRTMFQSGKAAQIAPEMQRYNIALLGISEGFPVLKT